MSEAGKTTAFILAAVVALGAAWMGQPKQVGVEVPDQIGLPLFADFTDPYDAKSMEVMEYDAELGKISTFEVAQKQGLWVIPSHQNYPADAEENLKAAATLLVDLKVINEVSDGTRKDHAEFGVVRPDPEKTRLGDAGIGKLVMMKDGKGNRLAEIIIGQEVQGQPSLRYVRKGDTDPVYVVEIDPTKMSTNFQDWVERDVLNVNGLDIKRLSIRDYSVNPELTSQGLQLSEEPRLELDVAWDEIENAWQLETLKEFRGREMLETPLLDNEELDKLALDNMKMALDDLVIVDVEQKPASLASGTTDVTRDRDALQSLLAHGFYPFQDDAGQLDLRSSDGEVIVGTKDSIEISLKFGGIEANSQTEGGKLNRFVMISAAVDKSKIEKPRLDLSGLEDDASVAAEEDTDPDNDQTVDETSGAEAAAVADEADESSTEDAAESSDDADANSEEGPATEQSDSAESDSAEDDSAEDEAEADTDQAIDSSDADAVSEGDADAAAEGDQMAADDSPPDDSEATSEVAGEAGGTADSEDEEDAAKDAERARRLKEYDRLMDQYNEKVEAANKKVDELNYRFREWYYVVAEDEYNKIHLHRSDVVKEKEGAAEEGSGIDAFRQLQEKGLEQSEN